MMMMSYIALNVRFFGYVAIVQDVKIGDENGATIANIICYNTRDTCTARATIHTTLLYPNNIEGGHITKLMYYLYS